MKKTILEVYALAVCFFAVACFVVTLGIGLYDIVQIVDPEFTLNRYQYERYQSNDAFRAAPDAMALASYGQNPYVYGRLAAKQVHRVLLGANPADMPVEQVDRLHFIVNLKTAKALGLTIPSSVLIRADEVIE